MELLKKEDENSITIRLIEGKAEMQFVCNTTEYVSNDWSEEVKAEQLEVQKQNTKLFNDFKADSKRLEEFTLMLQEDFEKQLNKEEVSIPAFSRYLAKYPIK